MNIKNLFAVSAALAICISFTACSENNSSKKNKTSSAAESNNEMSAEIPAKITVSPKSKLTEREYKGYYIANGITTGINLHAPEGLTVTDCETFENSDGTFTCMPECVPTASKPFVISDESGKDNMNFFASAGPGQEEFKKITKESYEEEYVKGVSDYFTDVEIKDFMSQEELAGELEKAGAFILPSVTEPWALVIHEAACSGLPVLASACCGAVSCFVKDGENGFLFKPANKRSTRKAIERFIHLPELQWIQMGRKSRELSDRITPSKVADCILTVLK